MKIDYWKHHKKELQNSLPIIQYMTDSGISFFRKLLKRKTVIYTAASGMGTAVVFEHIPGELCEEYSTLQLYDRLAKIYRLKTDKLKLETENFGTERIDTFLNLQCLPEVPAEVKTVLAKKKPDIFRYPEHLKQFSTVCKGSKENFHITHGDAGGNCILNKDELFLVDWDSCLLAPIERDAWIFIW